MNDIMLAFALIGAYSLGILSTLGAIAYLVKRTDDRAEKDRMAMDEAIGLVQDAMPGTTVLDYTGLQA